MGCFGRRGGWVVFLSFLVVVFLLFRDESRWYGCLGRGGIVYFFNNFVRSGIFFRALVFSFFFFCVGVEGKWDSEVFSRLSIISLVWGLGDFFCLGYRVLMEVVFCLSIFFG